MPCLYKAKSKTNPPRNKSFEEIKSSLKPKEIFQSINISSKVQTAQQLTFVMSNKRRNSSNSRSFLQIISRNASRFSILAKVPIFEQSITRN